jgi:hypothetical protein
VRRLGRRGCRRPQSLLRTLGKAVIASRNSQHLPLRFGIIQFAGTDARLVGAVALVLSVIGQGNPHVVNMRCESLSKKQYALK